MLTLEDSLLCDVYSFQVTAQNAAGTSSPSEIITENLLSLLDITTVEDSLQHTLSQMADGVTLRISLNVSSIRSCMYERL